MGLKSGLILFTSPNFLIPPHALTPGKSVSGSVCLSLTAAAKSLQSCPTLCDPRDGSPPGFPVPGILQARTLEWAAISFSSAWKWKVKVKSLSRARLFATPWTAAYQAPLSMDFPGKSTGVGCHCLLRPKCWHWQILMPLLSYSCCRCQWKVSDKFTQATAVTAVSQLRPGLWQLSVAPWFQRFKAWNNMHHKFEEK